MLDVNGHGGSAESTWEKPRSLPAFARIPNAVPFHGEHKGRAVSSYIRYEIIAFHFILVVYDFPFLVFLFCTSFQPLMRFSQHRRKERLILICSWFSAMFRGAGPSPELFPHFDVMVKDGGGSLTLRHITFFFRCF